MSSLSGYRLVVPRKLNIGCAVAEALVAGI